MDSNCSNSKGGDSKISRKRKLVAIEETESTPEKRPLIKIQEHQDRSIFDLPDELLVKIVSMVNIGQWPSLESINRRFRDVIYSSWNQIRELRLDEFRFVKGNSSNNGNTRIMNMAISKFTLRSPNITSITGSGLDTKDPTPLHRSWFKSLAKFENLEQIAFGRNKFCWANLEWFLESAACRQHLKVLDMSKVSICSLHHDDEESDLPLIQLDTFIGSVDAFIIAMRFFDAASLKSLILKKLNFEKYDNRLSLIIRQCRGLEKLEFGVPFTEVQLRAVPLFKSVASLKNLTSLKMDGQGTASLEARSSVKDLIRILGRRRRISSIALTCDEEIIREITQNLSFLKSLDLDIYKMCSTASYIQLITQLKELETLRFRRNNGALANFNSQVMQSIVANLPGLKSLHIENPICESKDFDGLVDLPLKELHIKGAKLENSTIELWGKSGFGSGLESLELINWHGGLKQEVLAKLINKSPRLRRLHLSNVTNTVVTAINSCPFLTELALTEWKDLSLESVQSIIDHCGNLKILNLDSPKSLDHREPILSKYRNLKTYWRLKGSKEKSSDPD